MEFLMASLIVGLTKLLATMVLMLSVVLIFISLILCHFGLYVPILILNLIFGISFGFFINGCETFWL
jgi:hypothetical protein